MKTNLAFVLWVLLTTTGTAHANLTRPLAKNGPTPIFVSVYVLDIDEVNSADQSFKANVIYQMRWRDPSLSHRAPGKVRRPLNEVWHPGLQIVSQQRVFPTFAELVEIAPDGEVLYRQRIWGSFSQPLNVRRFPFDRQIFTLHFVSEAYRPDEVQLTQDTQVKSGIADVLSFADWDIVRWETRTEAYRTNPQAEPIAGFVFSFEAARRYGYFVLKIILPLVFIVAMSWAVFWIDPHEGATQISVSITTILTLIAYQFSIGHEVPRVSYLTRLDMFILGSTILIFGSLVEVMVTTALAKRGQAEKALLLDNWSRWLFPAAFAVVIALTILGR